MKKILSTLVLMLSGSFFAGCAVNADADLDSDDVSEPDEAAGTDEDTGSAASALTCAQWTPSPATCSQASRLCADLPPNYYVYCDTVSQCIKCEVEFEP